jgi:hypothetical protein
MYQITERGGIVRLADGASIPTDPRNPDYADFVRWTESGNAPIPYSKPPPTAEDVRAEAQRRIIVLTGTQDIIGCLIKQHNAQMRATELTLIQAQGGTWTAEQAAEAAALQSLALQIKAIRAASNVLEPNPPQDYTDDKYWP